MSRPDFVVVTTRRAVSKGDDDDGGDASKWTTTRDARGGRCPAGDADRTARTTEEGGTPRRRGWGSETSHGVE
jgi:hypothetical protein